MVQRLHVRLTPSGGADRIDGVSRGPDGAPVLKARVKPPPEDGKANAALEALLAKALKLPKSAVSVTRGSKSRLKTISIEGLDAAALEAFLAQHQEQP